MFVKNFLLALLCGVAVLSFGTQSHAVVLEFENFDYPDGSLLAQSFPKWENHSGTATQMQVASGEAVVHEDGSQSEDLHLSFALSSGDVYYGLDFRVDSGVSFPPVPNLDPNGDPIFPDNEYFAHFKDTGFNFSSRLDIVAPNDNNFTGFSVGIGSDDSVADAKWATDLSFDTDYRVIVRYNQDDNIAELWIDPVSAASTSILGDDKPDPGDNVSQFALRQSFGDAGETIRVDNIVIGTTFADVLVAVPEPASLLLMLAGLAGLATRRRL